MRNFEELSRELESQGKARGLRELADSEDGARLAALLPAEKLEQAAKSGDSAALRDLIGTALRTQEGRRLAEGIRKLMEK